MTFELPRVRLHGAVQWLVAFTGVMFIAQQFWGPTMVYYLGLTPEFVLHRYWLWQPFTYLFLHGGPFHFLLNMFILWIFGAELERRWGSAEFLKFFFICGLGAAATLLVITPHSMVPAIGSSGAAFGFMVAFAMLFPDAVMYMYFLIPMKAWHAAIFFAFVEFFFGGTGSTRFAHLGGMLTAFLYLRFSDEVIIQIKSRFRSLQAVPRPRVELHEVTDELVVRVDRILDKVLRDGVDSLTAEEKRIMDRYAKTKH